MEPMGNLSDPACCVVPSHYTVGFVTVYHQNLEERRLGRFEVALALP